MKKYFLKCEGVTGTLREVHANSITEAFERLTVTVGILSQLNPYAKFYVQGQESDEDSDDFEYMGF